MTSAKATPRVLYQDATTELPSLPRRMLDELLEGCQIIGFDYTYVYINEAAAQHGRSSRGELVGRTMMDAYPGIEQTPMFELLQRCMQDRTPQQLENEFVFPDGSSGWFELRFAPVAEGVFVFSIDVTGRKRTEKALRKSRRALTALGECNQALVRATDELTFMQEVCTVVVHRGHYETAWIGLWDDSGESLVPVAQATRSGSNLRLVRESLHDTIAPRVARTSVPETSRTSPPAGDHQRLRGDEPEGLTPWIVLPIRNRDTCYGALVIHAVEKDAFDEEERALLDKMALDLGHGIGTLRAQQARERAEAADRESRRKHALLLSHLPGMAYRCRNEPGWRMEIVSDGCAALTGYGVEDLVGGARVSYGDLIHPEDRAQVRREVQAALASDRHYELEYRICDARGQEKWVWERGSAVRDAYGNLEALEGFVADISDRKRSEEQVRVVNERMERLARVVQDLSGARTLDAVTAIVRTAARDLVQSDGATFVLRDGDRCHYVDEDAIAPLWKGKKFPMSACISGWVMLHQQPAEIEDVFADDRIPHDVYRATFVKSLVMLPIRREQELDALGAIGAYWATHYRATPEDVRILQALSDATSVALENLRIYRELAEGKERNHAIHNHMPNPTFIWERHEDGFLLADFNEAARLATQRSAGTLIGKPSHELETNFPGLEADIRRCFETRATLRREASGIFPGTTEKRQLVMTYGFVPNDMIILHAEDVTEQRQTEAQLRIAQKLEAIGQLAGGIAHDFNNLVTIIISYAGFAIGQLRAEDPMRADLVEVQKAGERAANLTRQLLAFSRKQIIEPEVLVLNESIQSVEGLLRRLLGENIDIDVRLAQELGCVEADPGQIEQVVMNLAINARDAMPDGGKLTIETRDVELDASYADAHAAVVPGRYVMLSVSDTGCGMDAETRACIFDPFFTTKEQGKGTGLGLATVYGIVKQNGGNIWVYSESGQGTTFKVYLPRVDMDASYARRSLSLPPIVPGSETLLLVEDEDAVRRLAERILKASGYHVLSAATAEQAWSHCRRHDGPIHLMVTDVVLPDSTGPSGSRLADELRELCPDLKVLYMSGYTDDAIVRHGILAREVSFIGKPFTAAALTRKVREVLDGKA